MQNKNRYQYTKIRDNIWQIAEDNGVFCTLIQGSEKALLIDTGYGQRNLRAFVEDIVKTPYMVANSHGHPDHIGGNHWFETVWAVREEWEVIRYFSENPQTSMAQLYQTLQNTIKLDFDTYLCGHSCEEYPKEKLSAHIRNIENLKVDESTKENTIGFETYHSIYQDHCGRSEIVFTEDRVQGMDTLSN